MMNVYCIVVTYNGSKWVEKCFGSLLNASQSLKIIAVDNASFDDTVSLIKQKFPSVHLIETGANLGFGQANNIGLKLAINENADYVFLLNQDAWIAPGCIEELIKVNQNNNDFGILSPMHLDPDDQTLEYKFKEYVQPPFSDGMVSDLFLNRIKPVYETSFVNAAAWLISRACLQTVGGFDPLFYHYGEDVDYIQRAHFFKYKTGIATATRVWHDSRIQTWDEIKWNKKRMMMIYFYQLKSVGGSLRSNALVFLKQRFDEITSSLLFGKFKLFFFQIKLTLTAIFSLNKILKSRRASVSRGAFLYD